MTPREWQSLSYRDQRARWPSVSVADREAIMREEKTGAPAEPKYSAPVVCAVLYVAAFAACIGGSVLLFGTSLSTDALLLFGAAVSLIAWAQMLDHIARTAHYTQRTAELLAQVQPSLDRIDRAAQKPVTVPTVRTLG